MGNLGGVAGQRPGIADRPVAGQLPAERLRPEQRPNWNDWSQNRGQNWQQAVNNRQGYWNNWANNRQQNINDFQQNQGARWDQIQNNQQNRQDWFNQRQNDRQDWRVDNREDWQNYRQERWDYRWDRADEVWDNVRDYHDDLFDDRWWGACGVWGGYYPPSYSYPSNPWWWWVPTAWNTVSAIVSQPDPVYYDYGTTVIYEGDQVYQNGQPPVPAEQYREQAITLAVLPEQAPPPTPAAPAAATGTAPAAEEWMPLGVWALTQEEKGDAIMFFQISVNRAGIISGGFQNVMTGESKPIVGSVDKQSQRAAWRIGENSDTVIETGLFNLTKDVTPVSMHFGTKQTQTWLMVRLPAPQMPGVPTKVDSTGKQELPPVMGAGKAKPVV
jgi:hypothetical protein